jgi:hypothetical protein
MTEIPAQSAAMSPRTGKASTIVANCASVSLRNVPPVEHESEYWARVALGCEPFPAQAAQQSPIYETS